MIIIKDLTACERMDMTAVHGGKTNSCWTVDGFALAAERGELSNPVQLIQAASMVSLPASVNPNVDCDGNLPPWMGPT
jgi:hypothetical protein